MRHDCSSDGCGRIANERMRYFPGRFMSARDFTDEQDYFRTHRYLHNRMLHGWGVVRGLHVFPHPNPECRKDHVKLQCGMAVDCCGREIVVPKTLVPPPVPWSTRPPPQGGWIPLLCLEYDEDEAERVPVLYSERNCDAERREFSRVAETYELEWHWVRRSDLPAYGWKTRAGGCPEPSKGPDGNPNPCADDDCYQDEPRAAEDCFELDCPPDSCVPLAWIDGDGSAEITADSIVTLGRATLEVAGQSLTHICAVNWPHGGVVSRSQLENTLRRLEIRFDRRLRRHRAGEDPNSGPTGVNACTFVVQFGDGYDDLDYVGFTKPPRVEDDCLAVYDIDPRNARPFAYLENRTVFVTLKCDFVLDCHDVPVDGDHLGGLLPSGDGVRGGTFESWFRVMPDGEQYVPARQPGGGPT